MAKVVNGNRREFMYDHGSIIAEYNGGAPVAHYAFGTATDEVAIANRGGNNYFYLKDGLGSVVAIADSTGNVVQHYAYDAWGNIKQNTGSFAFSGSALVNDFTYTGREYDNESGLYYYRSRTYDPAIGRFLQKDPLQGKLDDPQTGNHYSYAGNSPVNRTDPSGEEDLVEYSAILNGPTDKAAAAFIGFFQGFGVTNLEFVGQYLGLVNTGLSASQLDAEALALTEAAVTNIEGDLGIFVQNLDTVKPPDLEDGIPGAFATGYDLDDYVPEFGKKILEFFDDLDQLGFKNDIKLPDYGGFSEGATAAFERLQQLFHP